MSVVVLCNVMGLPSAGSSNHNDGWDQVIQSGQVVAQTSVGGGLQLGFWTMVGGCRHGRLGVDIQHATLVCFSIVPS